MSDRLFLLNKLSVILTMKLCWESLSALSAISSRSKFGEVRVPSASRKPASTRPSISSARRPTSPVLLANPPGVGQGAGVVLCNLPHQLHCRQTTLSGDVGEQLGQPLYKHPGGDQCSCLVELQCCTGLWETLHYVREHKPGFAAHCWTSSPSFCMTSYNSVTV